MNYAQLTKEKKVQIDILLEQGLSMRKTAEVLGIARAFIQKTEIILFDEATSALDNDTQRKIRQAINNLKNEYTILIIAHRFSTIINCDRNYYIEEGKAIGSGSHEELLKICKKYKHLYESEIKDKI